MQWLKEIGNSVSSHFLAFANKFASKTTLSYATIVVPAQAASRDRAAKTWIPLFGGMTPRIEATGDELLLAVVILSSNSLF